MFSVFNKVPARLNLAIMIFTACWVNYMMRVNISINIIAMVPSDSTITSVKSECEAFENKETNSSYLKNPDSYESRHFLQREGLVTFDWTAQQQAYVLSGYFWSYAVTCFVGGRVVELIGPRMLIFSTTLLSAVLNTLSPQAAKIHYLVLVAFRFIIGFAAGFIFPAVHDLMARWVPPEERSKFVSATLGGAIGTVFTWTLTGPLIDKFGWDYAFYVPGMMIIIWCFVWWCLVYDSPLEHPRISETEKQYILKAIGDKVVQTSKNRTTAPYKNIFLSFAFWALIVFQYGNAWGVYFIMTAAPKYVSSALGFNLSSTGTIALGFNLSSTGTIASLPYLARMVFSVGFGVLGDKIVKLNVVSLTFIRKFFTIFSHIIPGLFVITLGYVGCSPILSICLITFSLGINGAATITNLVNHQDLAPNFAATMFGISLGIGNTAGFLTPLVTAHFTQNGNGFAEWRPVFLIGGGLYIASAIYFILFGSAKTQPWNYINMAKESSDNKVSPTNCVKV